ncbi:uncharacterized protein SPSC_00865 [Sporisorium scitamineum]|uniref:SWR1-complex protein 5 n=1 Tax=Sporisorium scitamineum TaxID=49012 RepID=A0A0F7S5K2_9BASI|nr:uncharacterized protein SPSC_00865 [Sporisorium scitamineum]CDW94304.1 hypothetical protein [Sporisorium scitamineum]
MATDYSSKSKVAANTASDSGSDSEDDDFIPEPEPSRRAATGTEASNKHPREATGADDDSDEDSDDEGSIAEGKATGGVGVAGEQIDADELEALKREREEMVAAAGGEDRLGKRRRLEINAAPDSAEPLPADDEADALKAKALAEWEAIKGEDPRSATCSGDASTSQLAQSGSSTTATTEEMISIPTTYKFAGELHTSTRLLPRSHPDVIKYLASQSASSNSAATTSSALPSETSKSTPAPASAAGATPRPPPPGPRRKKGSLLAALSAAATAKPTKLNTLEKSKLDWDSYKGDTEKLSQQELDELEHQTKGGGKGLGDMKGYLERRDFLDRVKDRTSQP